MEALAEPDDKLAAARKLALSFEHQLDPAQRKRLGQFFTGLALSRLLASIAFRQSQASVIDPMAGHGDLLDAIMERSLAMNGNLSRIEAVEIDPATARQCSSRLRAWKTADKFSVKISQGNTFSPNMLKKLAGRQFDLVITNPPYVRYQTVAEDPNISAADTRRALFDFAESSTLDSEQSVWTHLVQGYSGLSDLSVPSWLLSAMLTKPGGNLALVVPATWRTRNYADVLRYLLRRFFRVETIVADQQPGWFSDALVRTHLLVATRLEESEVAVPLAEREKSDHKVNWVEVNKAAHTEGSLVGAIFPGSDPEGRYAEWLCSHNPKPVPELKLAKHHEDQIFRVDLTHQPKWVTSLEPNWGARPLFRSARLESVSIIPHDLQELVTSTKAASLKLPDQVGIRVSQGLRTGCNGFFYVDLVRRYDGANGLTRPDPKICSNEFLVPVDALRSAVRRQSDLDAFESGEDLASCILELSGYVLPEDLRSADESKVLYRAAEVPFPSVMPDSLAEFVRTASRTMWGKNGKTVPQLSAVETNVRAAQKSPHPKPPRYWYMLPKIARRHEPDAFVPRVNQHHPRTYINRKPPLIIDANFSTLWSEDTAWTPRVIAAVLNSVWCIACMEAIGTPMGGGALKLEATHIRRLPLPHLTPSSLAELDSIAGDQSISGTRKINRIVASAMVDDRKRIDQFLAKLHELAARFQQDRMRR